MAVKPLTLRMLVLSCCWRKPFSVSVGSLLLRNPEATPAMPHPTCQGHPPLLLPRLTCFSLTLHPGFCPSPALAGPIPGLLGDPSLGSSEATAAGSGCSCDTSSLKPACPPPLISIPPPPTSLAFPVQSVQGLLFLRTVNTGLSFPPQVYWLLLDDFRL